MTFGNMTCVCLAGFLSFSLLECSSPKFVTNVSPVHESSYASGDMHGFLVSHGYIDGKEYKTTVHDHAVPQSPTWNPLKEDVPPITPGEAFRIAREGMRKQFGSRAVMSQSIDLSEAAKSGRWFYQVSFHLEIDFRNPNVRSEYITYVVVMDGTVIQPVEAPEGGDDPFPSP